MKTSGRKSNKGWVVCMAVALAACTPVIVPDGATMPRTQGGTPIMSDEGAIWLSAYALAVPSRTAGDPVTAARAAASIDYLASALYLNPRWDDVPITTKAQMVQGRAAMRQALGIAPAATTQEVVDRLIAASNAMEGRDVAQADRALTSPVFTLGPGQTLALLNDLPYVPAANIAAQKANQESTPRSGHCGNFPCP